MQWRCHSSSCLISVSSSSSGGHCSPFFRLTPCQWRQGRGNHLSNTLTDIRINGRRHDSKQAITPGWALVSLNVPADITVSSLGGIEGPDGTSEFAEVHLFRNHLPQEKFKQFEENLMKTYGVQEVDERIVKLLAANKPALSVAGDKGLMDLFGNNEFTLDDGPGTVRIIKNALKGNDVIAQDNKTILFPKVKNLKSFLMVMRFNETYRDKQFIFGDNEKHDFHADTSGKDMLFSENPGDANELILSEIRINGKKTGNIKKPKDWFIISLNCPSTTTVNTSNASSSNPAIATSSNPAKPTVNDSSGFTVSRFGNDLCGAIDAERRGHYQLAEVYMFEKQLPESQFLALEDYLMNKYLDLPFRIQATLCRPMDALESIKIWGNVHEANDR